MLVFCTDVVIARLFSSIDKGIFNYFTSTVLTLGFFSSLGLHMSYLEAQRANPDATHFYLRFLTGLLLLIALIQSITIFYFDILSYVKSTLYHLQDFFWLIAIVGDTFLQFNVTVILREKGALFYSVTRIFRASLILFLLCLGKYLEFSIFSILELFAFSSLIFNLLLIAYLWTLKLERSHKRPNILVISKNTIYGLKVHLNIISDRFLYRGILLIVGIFCTTKDVGIVAISIGLIDIMLSFSDSAAMFLIGDKKRINTDKEGYKSLFRLIRLVLLLSIISSIIFAILGKYLISLFYGESFIDAYTYLLILLPSGVIHTLYKIIIGYFQGAGKGNHSTILSLIIFLTYFTLSLTFTKSFGVIGSCIAASLVYFLSAVLSLFFLFYASEIPRRDISKIIPSTKDLYFLYSKITYLYASLMKETK